MNQLYPHTKITFFRLLLMITILSLSLNLYSQIQFKNVNTMLLNVEDGLAMSRADDIVCDNQNIIWIKSSRGLQFWDGQQIHTFRDSILEVGSDFHLYPHSDEGILVAMPGLVKHVTFEGLGNKTIYKSADSENDFIPIPLPTDDSNGLIIHPDSLFYIDDNDKEVLQLIEQKLSEYSTNVRQYSFRDTDYLVDFFSYRSYINNSNLEDSLLAKVFVNRFRNTILINGDDIVSTTKDNLSFINNSQTISYPYPNDLEARYYSSILKLSDKKLLVGLDNKLCEFDLESRRWTYVYKRIDQNDFLQTGYFDKLIFDKYNNIWAVTVNEGLLKIYKNDSFKYFGTNDKKLNFVKNIVVDEADNRIIASALNGGILVYDTLGNQTRHLNSTNTNGLVNSVTGIYKIGANQYIYNNHRDSMLYGLTYRDGKARVGKIVPKNEDYLYYQDAIQLNADSSLLLFNTMYSLEHSSFKLTPLFQYISTKSCMIRDGEEIWVGCIDGILKYRLGGNDKYQFYPLPGEGYVRSISKWKNNTLALGTDKGFSIFNKTDSKLTLVDEGCIYCLLSDDEYNIWAGTGSGLMKYDADFNKVQYSSIDGLQNNEFNTNACVKSASGKMYFGGLNGITSFIPEKVPDKNHKASIYIKSLTDGIANLVTNSQTTNIENFELDHDQNNLLVSVGIIGKYESQDYNYQYFIEGISSKWIDAKNQTSYNFNLAPGKYKIFFSASNAFNPTAPKENPLEFTIKNPWWKQWWFYLGSIVLITGIAIYLIQAREKQKYLKKKFEWELQYQRQEDRIQMSKELHDNIGSRLAFLVSSIENIKKAFQINSPQAINKIDHLTDFGKDTIEDLRSMMWVLNQKSITVLDLQLKLLDYLNIAKNSYKNIDFQYEGPETGLDQKLDSKLSQNIFRVIQEGIHNSIKHAHPTEISIRIRFENDKIQVSITDNGNGFELENTQRGNGISNMKSRLSEHQSEINISSHPGKGTDIQFEINTAASHY